MVTINEKTNIPLFIAAAATVAIVGGVISFVIFAVRMDSRLENVERGMDRIEIIVADSVNWSGFVNWTERLKDKNPTLDVPTPRK